jgi:hypothetical protein
VIFHLLGIPAAADAEQEAALRHLVERSKPASRSGLTQSSELATSAQMLIRGLFAGRKATIRLERDREFADSPLEGTGFELMVPADRCGGMRYDLGRQF